MIEVYRAAGEAEANVIKGLLEANGIPCVLKYSIAPAVFDSLGQVKVMVSESMAEEAKSLIVRKEDA
jgi:hypothetical protein